MINIKDSELDYYRDNKKCVVCKKDVDYEPMICGCGQPDCEAEGYPVNIPLCPNTESTTDLDCSKVLYGWQLLEKRGKVNQFLNSFPEFAQFNYPKDKYDILYTLSQLERERAVTILQSVFGEDLWQYMN